MTIKGRLFSTCPQRSLYTSGGMVPDAPWRKVEVLFDDNDAFARVYNNLLLHEYIYYFTLVHF